MSNTKYTVTAISFTGLHEYMVGEFDDLGEAINRAEEESTNRAGKYKIRVIKPDESGNTTLFYEIKAVY